MNPDDKRYAYLLAMDIRPWRLRAASLTQSAAADDKPESADEPPPATPAPLPPVPGETPSREARIAASDWQELETEVRHCQACELHRLRTQTVFGVGDRSADCMIIGEAPGAEEDRLGEPFVGRAGKLLDLMLQAIQLDRGSVFIANILKSRPPNNRDPAPAEIQACWPYLMRQITLVKPKIIIAMGRIAAQTLLGTSTPVGKLRGQVHTFGDAHTIPMIVTYHPAYLLRSPREKRKSWQDLQLVRRLLSELN